MLGLTFTTKLSNFHQEKECALVYVPTGRHWNIFPPVTSAIAIPCGLVMSMLKVKEECDDNMSGSRKWLQRFDVGAAKKRMKIDKIRHQIEDEEKKENEAKRKKTSLENELTALCVIYIDGNLDGLEYIEDSDGRKSRGTFQGASTCSETIDEGSRHVIEDCENLGPLVEENSDYLLGTDRFGGAEKFGSGGAASTCSETIDEGSHHVIEDCENLGPLVEENSDYLLGTDRFGGAEKFGSGGAASTCSETIDEGSHHVIEDCENLGPLVEENSDYLLGTDSFGEAEKFGTGGAVSTCSETIDEGSRHVIEDCENLDPLDGANSDYLLGIDSFGGAEKFGNGENASQFFDEQFARHSAGCSRQVSDLFCTTGRTADFANLCHDSQAESVFNKLYEFNTETARTNVLRSKNQSMRKNNGEEVDDHDRHDNESEGDDDHSHNNITFYFFTMHRFDVKSILSYYTIIDEHKRKLAASEEKLTSKSCVSWLTSQKRIPLLIYFNQTYRPREINSKGQVIARCTYIDPLGVLRNCPGSLHVDRSSGHIERFRDCVHESQRAAIARLFDHNNYKQLAIAVRQTKIWTDAIVMDIETGRPMRNKLRSGDPLFLNQAFITAVKTDYRDFQSFNSAILPYMKVPKMYH
uniref:Uncharacterized protein n=1 Tax=Caenorhabditis japonica TaxID=281687 RepID=A0A8R1HSL2_CAEJA